MKQIPVIVFFLFFFSSFYCNHTSIEKILDGSFVPPPPSLTLESVLAMSETEIQIRFGEDLQWNTIQTTQPFSITNTQGSTLQIVHVKHNASEDPNIIILETEQQPPNEIFILSIHGLKGIQGEITPESGFSREFSTFPLRTLAFHFISYPSTLLLHESFSVTLAIRYTDDGSIPEEYAGDLVWDWTGDGTISVISPGSWSNGERTVQLQYDHTLSGGATETIALQVTDSQDDSISGSTGNIQAIAPIELSHFQVRVPQSVRPGESFDVTIQAMGNDGYRFTDYNGTVQLKTISNIQETNTLQPATATGFILGSKKITTSLDELGSTLRIVATDMIDPSITGSSNSIKIGMGIGTNHVLNVLAVPYPSTMGIRISWSEVEGATHYLIYSKKVSDPDFSYVATASHTYDYHIPNLDQGETYLFKIVAQSDVIGYLLEAISEQVTVKGCTELSNDITSDTTLDKAASPYCITTDIAVQSSVLTIEPGCVLLMDESVYLEIDGGTLIMNGSETEPIIMTANSTNPAPEYWLGIRFLDGAVPTTFDGTSYHGGSLIRHAIIEYGGSAITNVNTSLLIEHSYFRYNQSGSGGALRVQYNGTQTLVIRSSKFEYNWAEFGAGGAGYFKVIFPGTPTFLLEDNDSSYNIAQNHGGAFNIGGGSITVTDSYFANNQADDGGALVIGANDAIISENRFQNNQALDSGGAIHTMNQNMTVSNNTFLDNHADGGGGGAIYVFEQGATITDNLFRRNKMTNSDGGNGGGALELHNDFHVIQTNLFEENESLQEGGAIYINGDQSTFTENQFIQNYGHIAGGAMSLAGDIYTVEDNLFDRNNAKKGGALYIYNSMTGTRNSFIQNSASFLGGAIHLGEPNASTCTYSLFQGNTATNKGGAIYLDGGTGSATFSHSSVYANTALYGNSIFSNHAGTTDMTFCYWGGATTKADMGVCDALEVCDGSSLGTVNITDAYTAPLPFCTDGTSPDCVGAP
jgi:predicted outer membrane repeat protein